MKTTRIALIAALAAVVLIGTGGAAGTVAAAPGLDDAAAGADAGPPSDLPGPVPDFVGDILDSVGEFLSGDLSDLGETVSGIAGGDAADETDGGADEGGEDGA